MSMLYGPYIYGEGAGEAFDAWYMQRPEPEIDDGGFFGREHEHVLKLSLVLAACRRKDRVIKVRDVQDAIRSLAEIGEGIKLAFKDVEYHSESGSMKFVESVIREDGPITKSALLKRVYRRMSQRELDDHLNMLRNAGILIRETDDRPGSGRKATIYRIKKEAKPDE